MCPFTKKMKCCEYGHSSQGLSVINLFLWFWRKDKNNLQSLISFLQYSIMFESKAGSLEPTIWVGALDINRKCYNVMQRLTRDKHVSYFSLMAGHNKLGCCPLASLWNKVWCLIARLEFTLNGGPLWPYLQIVNCIEKTPEKHSSLLFPAGGA